MYGSYFRTLRATELSSLCMLLYICWWDFIGCPGMKINILSILNMCLFLHQFVFMLASSHSSSYCLNKQTWMKVTLTDSEGKKNGSSRMTEEMESIAWEKNSKENLERKSLNIYLSHGSHCACQRCHRWHVGCLGDSVGHCTWMQRREREDKAQLFRWKWLTGSISLVQVEIAKT